VYHKDSSDKGRSYSPSIKALALIAMLVLVFGGGWSSPRLDELRRELAPEAVAARSAGECAATADRLVRAARLAGIDPREALGFALPEPRMILGMLALDRDIDDFAEHADRKDAAGSYYRDEARISLEMRPLRSRYEAAFAAASCALSGRNAPRVEAADASSLDAKDRRPPYIASPEDVWLPPKSELAHSHPYALDVFFQSVDRSGEAEKGPPIRALYPGIVIATACDWSGGQGISTWASGGLSPAAGNGLVIYDPASRRYCSYFHLSSLALRPGDVVDSGATIGRGGNSGMNARVKGHGEHVHIEIFDAARDESLSSAEILDLLMR
jgi:murein DD-endopeptidase MepM/ murein hydrolase activator NlpD